MLKRAATPQSFWPDGCPSSILLLSAWTNAFSGLDIQLQRVPTQNAHILWRRGGAEWSFLFNIVQKVGLYRTSHPVGKSGIFTKSGPSGNHHQFCFCQLGLMHFLGLTFNYKECQPKMWRRCRVAVFV